MIGEKRRWVINRLRFLPAPKPLFQMENGRVNHAGFSPVPLGHMDVTTSPGSPIGGLGIRRGHVGVAEGGDPYKRRGIIVSNNTPTGRRLEILLKAPLFPGYFTAKGAS